MSYRDRQNDPVRQRFAAETRDYHLDKMRKQLGMPAKDRMATPGDAPRQVAPVAESRTPSQAPAAPDQVSTAPVCTCNDMGECDVCRDWARRMLELSRGKKP